jgi:hypothetical protein
MNTSLVAAEIVVKELPCENRVSCCASKPVIVIILVDGLGLRFIGGFKTYSHIKLTSQTQVLVDVE